MAADIISPPGRDPRVWGTLGRQVFDANVSLHKMPAVPGSRTETKRHPWFRKKTCHAHARDIGFR